MELTWEYSQMITETGHNPAAFHSPDNLVQVFFLTDTGEIMATEAMTPLGEWADREFGDQHLAAPDSGAEYLKLCYLPRLNIWLYWRIPDPEEASNYIHRMAVYTLKQEADRYLKSGSMSYRQDTPVVNLRLVLENPLGIITPEESDQIEQASAFPGTRISLFYSAGDSARIGLGIFYTDRINYEVGSPTVNVEARNASGKLLNDQSFDEDHTFGDLQVELITGEWLGEGDGTSKLFSLENAPAQAVQIYINGTQQTVHDDYEISRKTGAIVFIEAPGEGEEITADYTYERYEKASITYIAGKIMEEAGIVNYAVESSEIEVALRFPPEMPILTGLQEVLKLTDAWLIKETSAGTVLIGSPTYFRFLPGTYGFYRNRDIFSREVIREDREVFSRVCVWADEYQETRERGVERVLAVDVDVDVTSEINTAVTVDVEGTDYSGTGHQEAASGSGTGTGQAKETVIEEYQVTIPAIHAYADVDFLEGWNLPSKKTLYVQVAEGTTEAECQALADQVAARIANVGVVESFSGPFRPQIQPGDQASIWEPGRPGRLLGLITEVRLDFGEPGFYTSFTVDSGGVIRKPAIKDLIDQIAGRRELSTAIRRLDLEEEEGE